MKKSIIFLLLIVQSCLAQNSLQGTVSDTNKKPLSSANLIFLNSGIGVTTGENGEFDILFPKQLPDTLLVSYIGFIPQKILIESIQQSPVRITLASKVLSLEQITIESEKPFDVIVPMAPGERHFTSIEIQNSPITLYPELNQTLLRLPGVTVRNEFSSELYVRGGGADQNLVLLEGIPIYYPYHLFGLATAVNLDMIGGFYFSPGGFPSNFGNRISSVLSITSIVPEKRLEGSIDLSIISSAITLAGKQSRWLNWVVSYRKSYYQWFLNSIGNGFPYKFQDIFTKISLTPNKTNQLDLILFQFEDDYKDETSMINYEYHERDSTRYLKQTQFKMNHYGWSNQLMGVKWRNIWSPQIKSQLSIYQSVGRNRFQIQFDSEFETTHKKTFENIIELRRQDDLANNHQIKNRFMDRTAKVELFINHQDYQWNSGIDFSEIYFSYGWNKLFTPMTAIFDYQDKINLFFDYAPDEFSLDEKVQLVTGFTQLKRNYAFWDFQIGLRLSQYLKNSGLVAEPRLNIVIHPESAFDYAFAIGKYTQPYFTALENGLVTFLPLYFVIEDSMKPPTANHYILGVTYTGKRDITAKINLYYKAYQNLIQSVGPGPNYKQWSGSSYGLESELGYHTEAWDFQAAIAFAKSYRQQNTYKVPTNWDQRFRLDTEISRSFYRRLKFSVMWHLYSGIPYVSENYIAGIRNVQWRYPLDQQTLTVYDEISVDVEPGQIRFPWYHRLDLFVSCKFQLFGRNSLVYFSLRNVYARKNVLYYEGSRLGYDTKEGQYVDYHIKNPYKWLPPMPALGLQVKI